MWGIFAVALWCHRVLGEGRRRNRSRGQRHEAGPREVAETGNIPLQSLQKEPALPSVELGSQDREMVNSCSQPLSLG